MNIATHEVTLPTNCPICNGVPTAEWCGQGWIECRNCGLRGPYMPTPEAALAAWNNCSLKRAHDGGHKPGTKPTPDAGRQDGGEAEAAMILAREKWAASREAFPPTMVQRFAYADGWHAALAWMAEKSKAGEQ